MKTTTDIFYYTHCNRMMYCIKHNDFTLLGCENQLTLFPTD